MAASSARRSLVLAAIAGGVGGAASWAPWLWPLAWAGVAAIAFVLARAPRRTQRMGAAYASQLAWLVACTPYLPSTLRLSYVTSSGAASWAYACVIWLAVTFFLALPIAAAAELRTRVPAYVWLPPAWLLGEKLRDLYARWSIDWLYSQWHVGSVLALLALAGWWVTSWACLAVATLVGDAVTRRSARWLAPVAVFGLLVALLPRPRGGAKLDGVAVVTLATNMPFPPAPAEDVTLLVWPEGALPTQPLLTEGKPLADESMEPPRRGTFAHLLGVVGRLRGAVIAVEKKTRRLGGGKATLLNAAVALSPDGVVLGVRGKSGLFPITEEPLFGIIGDSSRATMVVGTAEPMLEVGGHRVVPLICVEAMRRGLAARGVAAGGDMIAILSSDIGLRESRVGLEEMLAVATMRAVEYHVPVVRASLDGYSAIIDADGTMLAISTRGEPGVLRPRR